MHVLPDGVSRDADASCLCGVMSVALTGFDSSEINISLHSARAQQYVNEHCLVLFIENAARACRSVELRIREIKMVVSLLVCAECDRKCQCLDFYTFFLTSSIGQSRSQCCDVFFFSVSKTENAILLYKRLYKML